MLANSTSLKSTTNTLSYSKVSDNWLGNVSVKTILRGPLFFSPVIAKTVRLKYKMFTVNERVLKFQFFRFPRWVLPTFWSSVGFWRPCNRRVSWRSGWTYCPHCTQTDSVSHKRGRAFTQPFHITVTHPEHGSSNSAETSEHSSATRCRKIL